MLGGRPVTVARPRARTAEGTEVALDTYAAFADDDLLATVVMERMLAGFATRRHRAANEPVGEAVEAEGLPRDVARRCSLLSRAYAPEGRRTWLSLCGEAGWSDRARPHVRERHQRHHPRGHCCVAGAPR